MEFITRVIFVSTLLRTASSQTCSEANRNSNLEACLSEIGTVARDNVRFWFGSSYSTRCPDGPVSTDPQCALFTGLQIPQSIASLIYPDGNFDSSKLDTYLNVKYTSNPGNYSGCNNIYVSETTLRFTADPVSMATINCWDARDIPEMNWASEAGQFYSLIFLDAAYNYIHAMYVNILGNDITNADTIRSYVGPGHPSRFGNVYTFLLFKQNGRVIPDLRYSSMGVGQFNLTEFNALQNSTDLIAMNWILATGDLYTVGRARRSGLVDNCPSFLADDIKTQSRSFIPENPRFEVGVYLTYRSREMGYVSCCKSYSLQAQNITLNPLGDSWVKTGDVRNMPEIDLTRTILNFNATTDFEGKLYTLFMLDPANTMPKYGSADEPFIYWMVTNITGGDVPAGVTILPYIGITPFDDNPHQYYFLLYEQTGSISEDSLLQYTSLSCTGVLHRRCRLKITPYVADNNFKLVGATWMTAQNDNFVPYSRVQAGTPEAVACAGVPGYVAGCNACSRENRLTNLQTCLTDVASLAQDSYRYWFGSSYNQRCPNGEVPTELECTKIGLEIPQSIISLSYPPGVFNPRTLDRFLEINYTSLPGTFSSCGNEYRTETASHFPINPLSMETIDCWDARDIPEFSWRTDPNQLYSLVMYDAGFKYIHAIYVNIQGNDVKLSDVVVAYFGPGAILREGAVYTFYLFTQEGRTQPDPKFYNPNILNAFNMTEFMQLQKLTGPVAMNWIIASHDLYAAHLLKRGGFVDTCPTFVADGGASGTRSPWNTGTWDGDVTAVTEPSRPFIPEEPKFDVGIYVTYRSPQFRFASCCTQYLLPATNISLNPLGHGLVTPGQARNNPEVQLTRAILYINSAVDITPATAFTGKAYTLIMVDPDISEPAYGTNEKPFINWLVANIRNGDVTTGDTVLSYMVPAPFNDAVHYYYFLVYEQAGTVSPTPPANYTTDVCTGIDANRCLFDITKYVSVNSLQLVGATWMVSRKDEYVRYYVVNLGETETGVCEGVAGYVAGCKDDDPSGSQTLQLSVLTLSFACTLVGLLMY